MFSGVSSFLGIRSEKRGDERSLSTDMYSSAQTDSHST